MQQLRKAAVSTFYILVQTWDFSPKYTYLVICDTEGFIPKQISLAQGSASDIFPKVSFQQFPLTLGKNVSNFS